MSAPHITLEQWRTFVAVVDAGGYAQAAGKLHKTQSSVTYSVQKLQALLDVKAFEIRGRKAVLTPTGQLLYRRATVLIEEAAGIEEAARSLSAGWEAQISVAVEQVFPTWLILQCLDRFGREAPHTRIELIESVLEGTQEPLLQGHADLAIVSLVPTGYSGEALMRARFVLAAHPDHPLHRLGRKVTMQDLRAHRQFVVRETSARRGTRPFVEATQRWTVSSMSTLIIAARSGYGYAWIPEDKIRDELAAGTLAPLALREGGERYAELYLVFANRDAAGPGTLRLAEIIKAEAAQACTAEKRRGAARTKRRAN